MSGPKTVTLRRKEKRDAPANEQPCSPAAVCCEKIRERAYCKWEAAGCPGGNGVEFWLQAESELAAASQSEGNASKI